MEEKGIRLEKNYIAIAFDAISKAGKIALSFEKEKIHFWNKSVGQPVTHADIEINLFLKKFFEKHTPEFGWLSEESEDDKSRFTKKSFWCVDPIDGTRSYINKRPEYVISIALVSNSTPIFGLIFNPKTNEMFSAEKNFGAFCNKKKIKVSDNIDLNSCKVAISNSELKNIEKILFFKNLKILSMGSIAYKIALVAKGQVDIALSFTKKSDWDLAAASLILEEAGGLISDIENEKINYNTNELNISSVFAANPRIHRRLLNEIKKT